MMMSRSQAVGQVTLEYFVLFAVIGLLTVLSLTQFDEQVTGTLQGLFRSAAHCVATTATATTACEPKP